MLDRERILAKLDELDGYLRELHEVAPANIAEYRKVEKKRSCERLLQIAIECVIDIGHLFVTGLRLGLPAEEDDIFEKLERAGIISAEMGAALKRMKGCRNILVHEYARVDDEIIFDAVSTRLGDFDHFKREVISALERQ
ncbi:MAG TPA: DUF86 domain-containing protein [Candidatus Margulisiibacteriota bacterium]|nr:DUF86 domain-containing protein [Candidatus Margulisiibacteriota bacterium]